MSFPAPTVRVFPCLCGATESETAATVRMKPAVAIPIAKAKAFISARTTSVWGPAQMTWIIRATGFVSARTLLMSSVVIQVGIQLLYRVGHKDSHSSVWAEVGILRIGVVLNNFMIWEQKNWMSLFKCFSATYFYGCNPQKFIICPLEVQVQIFVPRFVHRHLFLSFLMHDFIMLQKPLFVLRMNSVARQLRFACRSLWDATASLNARIFRTNSVVRRPSRVPSAANASPPRRGATASPIASIAPTKPAANGSLAGKLEDIKRERELN